MDSAFRGQVDMAAIRVEDVVAVAGHHVPRRVSAEPPVASLEACRIGGLNLEEPARGDLLSCSLARETAP